jgi:ribonuclease D
MFAAEISQTWPTFVHEGDLPAGVFAGKSIIAIDSETMGLRLGRDPLCVVQLSSATATPMSCA